MNNNDMKNSNFDRDWDICCNALRSCRYPMDETELDNEIRRAISNDDRYLVDNQDVLPRYAHQWYVPLAVAAGIAALLLPTSLLGANRRDIRTVDFEGQRVAFACNDGCTIENTLNSFNDFIKYNDSIR